MAICNIHVSTEDPIYKGLSTHGFIPSSYCNIKKVVPIFGVMSKELGLWQVARYDFEGAKCVSLRVYTQDGEHYTAQGRESVIALIGLDAAKNLFGEDLNLPTIGFNLIEEEPTVN